MAMSGVPLLLDVCGTQVVGSVPEFKHGHERVAALEDRLEAMVSPALYDALYAHDSQQVSHLSFRYSY
jgi:hypothetical protein